MPYKFVQHKIAPFLGPNKHEI
jgi:hypothetical protein